jgi:hypothetical protein
MIKLKNVISCCAFQEHIEALRVIHELVPLRFTINPSDKMRQMLPEGVHFYGIVDSGEYQSIIAAAKVRVYRSVQLLFFDLLSNVSCAMANPYIRFFTFARCSTRH